MARLTAPNGVTVDVADDKVATLERHGFKRESGKKQPAKAASEKQSDNSK